MPTYKAPGLYVNIKDSGQTPIEAAGTSTAAFIGYMKKGECKPELLGKATLVTNWTEFKNYFGDFPVVDATKPTSGDGAGDVLSPEDKAIQDKKLQVPAYCLRYAVFQFFAEGGGKCWVVPVEKGGSVSLDAALTALDVIDDVNMIAIPDAKGNDTIIKAGIGYCDARNDCMFLIDSNPCKSMQDFIKKDEKGFYADAFRDANAAMYYPWIKARITKDEVEKERDILLPPSGAIAGIYARIDGKVGVHKAPAGTDTTLKTALGLDVYMNQKHQESFNELGINCIRAIPRAGICVWGARTLVPTTEWRYIPVRRLFLFLKKTLEQNLLGLVFQPNNSKLWAAVRRDISAFLTRVWRDGALVGDTPESAFFVKVDSENNPPASVNDGYLIVDVGIAPVKPAEFVVINLSQKQQTQQ